MIRRFVSIGVGCCCLASTAAAQDFQGLFDLTQFAASSSSATSGQEHPVAPKLIVLTSGKLVEGEISKSFSGYTVRSGLGSFLVPFQMVKLTADNRHEAYEKYLQLMPEETSANHTTLAKWCIRHQLIHDARTELKKAIFLDNENQEAIALLQQLDRIAEVRAAAAASSVPLREPLQVRSERSLEGLTRDEVREFSTAIQPILMNNCAQTGCHHARADNGFQLDFVRITGHGNRLASHRNLQSVIGQIDADQPRQSPLLIKAGDAHAGIGKTLSGSGPGAARSLRTLEQWTLAVSRSLQPESAVSRRSANPSRGDSSGESSKELTDEDFVREILDRNRTDAFDPARFNRPPGTTQ
jgi:hypothetical protein